jgi:hypothetical protein
MDMKVNYKVNIQHTYINTVNQVENVFNILTFNIYDTVL